MVQGTFQAGQIDLQGGTISGSGQIFGDVLMGGELDPGSSPGTLTVNGDYTQTADGLLRIEIAGLGAYDRLIITGDASLDGLLEVVLLGYDPHAGDLFTILSWGGLLLFQDLDIDLPSLGGGYEFSTLWDADHLALRVNGEGGGGVPEPSTFTLLGLGLLAAGFLKRW